MAKKKKTYTDNSHLEEKVLLRLNSLNEIHKDQVNVLECFGGDGVIWQEVKKRSIKKINVLRIEIKNDKEGVYLRGDNMKFLTTMDLSGFDVVDLDAYGSPYNQLEVLFTRAYRGIIHCTFIQSGKGGINHGMCEKVGFTKNMLRKIVTLFNRSGWTIICQYLAINGIKSIELIKDTREMSKANTNNYYFWFKKG